MELYSAVWQREQCTWIWHLTIVHRNFCWSWDDLWHFEDTLNSWYQTKVRMTFSELRTVCFEAANLVNERPIARHPTLPEEGSYLCPNDLLLGRSTARVPSDPFKETRDERYRFEFVQSVVNSFWKKWTQSFFPSLLTRQKWHSSRRNLEVGDFVLIQDANMVRGNWKLGRVSQVYPDYEGKVRKVDVIYKHEDRTPTTVQRAVQGLVVLLPANQ